jgi:hypothetical protein
VEDHAILLERLEERPLVQVIQPVHKPCPSMRLKPASKKHWNQNVLISRLGWRPSLYQHRTCIAPIAAARFICETHEVSYIAHTQIMYWQRLCLLKSSKTLAQGSSTRVTSKLRLPTSSRPCPFPQHQPCRSPYHSPHLSSPQPRPQPPSPSQAT